MEDQMAKPKPWGEISVEEKLEPVGRDALLHQRQCAAAAKALEELKRRVADIERRLEESLLD
jgi:predicted RNase H-like nuclease (RuvC/YqgF family)